MAKYGYKILTEFATAGNNVVMLSRNTFFAVWFLKEIRVVWKKDSSRMNRINN